MITHSVLWSMCNENLKRKVVSTDTEWDYYYDVFLNEIVFIFGPTNSRLDWFQNFDIAIKPYKDMPRTWYCTRGISLKWDSVKYEVLQIIEERKPLSIWITGHSQGGAVAKLCHESVRFNTSLVPKTVTFGAQRVFSRLGYKNVQERLVGITNYQDVNDLVCKVPFGFISGGEIHKVGKKYTPYRLMEMAHTSYGNYL